MLIIYGYKLSSFPSLLKIYACVILDAPARFSGFSIIYYEIGINPLSLSLSSR